MYIFHYNNGCYYYLHQLINIYNDDRQISDNKAATTIKDLNNLKK